MQEFRSDVVGSLLRPVFLMDAQGSLARNEINPKDYKVLEDRSVDLAVDLQTQCGVEVVTDGEMRREHFFSHVADSFEGFDRYGGWTLNFRDEAGEETVVERPVVVGKLKRKRFLCAEEFTYLRAKTTLPIKATMPNVQQLASWYDVNKSKDAYPNVEAYLADVVDLMREDVAELIRLGCQYIQFDAPQYAALLDSSLREGYRQRGMDPDRILDIAVERDNAIISDLSGSDVIFALHICRGNARSKFYASGGYDPIADKVFRNLHHHRFLLEYDDARSGDFEPLRQVPEGKTVVLGLVSTKKPSLENKEALKGRIQEATRFIPLERLALSPQCGFASAFEGNLISEADQEAKLRLVAETAKEVWG